MKFIYSKYFKWYIINNKTFEWYIKDNKYDKFSTHK